MIHIDLFSGIGGFALAADRVFGDVEHIFCDNEPFAQAVLKKHWPEAPIYGDIRQITADTPGFGWGAGTGEELDEKTQKRGKGLDKNERPERPFILTGGFPCQPFSAAGARRGTADDRYLWPEMLRVIQLAKPTWVIAENVRGITNWNEGVVFEKVCADLEASGYQVQSFIVPAVAVNAPHRRDRVWFVAHRAGGRRQWGGAGTAAQEGLPAEPGATGQLPRRPEGQDSWDEPWPEVAARICSVYDGISNWLDESISKGVLDGSPSKRLTRQDLRTLWEALQSPQVWEAFGRCYKVSKPEVLLKALRELSERGWPLKLHEEGSSPTREFVREVWDDYEARRTPRGRGYYEQLAKQHQDTLPQLPYETALALAEAWHRVRFAQAIYDSEATETLSQSQHRKAQLKAYGNAIVPQVAMAIMEGMHA